MQPPKHGRYVICLDQYATSAMFDVNEPNGQWAEVLHLLKAGARDEKLFCPRSTEDYLETSQKTQSLAIKLDSGFDQLSRGYVFKPELFITSQLLISKIRKNNITLRTYLHEKANLGVFGNKEGFDSFRNLKLRYDQKIRESTVLSNEIRKNGWGRKVDQMLGSDLYTIRKSEIVRQFIERLTQLLKAPIPIRGVKFESGDVPNWIDLIIHRLTKVHHISRKEVRTLIAYLSNHGFIHVSTLDIRTSLTANLAVKGKIESPGDHIDIGRIVAGFTVSDIFLTDKKRKYEIQELGLDAKYGTVVLCGTQVDIESFTTLLSEINGL